MESVVSKHDGKIDDLPTASEGNESVSLGIVRSPPKRITVWSALGVSYSATCAPIAILIFLSLTIGVGGTPVFIYSYIISTIMNIFVCISLAEMASSRPHSAGQVFWSAEFSNPERARVNSFFSGFFAVGTWIFWYISCPLLTAQVIMATVQVTYPATSPQQWQIYLVMIGINLSTWLWNIPLFHTLERLNRVSVLLINAGSIFIFATLLARSSSKQRSHSVWLDIVNDNGWSTGVNMLISFLPGLNCVSGFDSAAHLAEEMEKPHRSVPIVMVGSAILSCISGFIMIMAAAYCTTNPENLLSPIGGQPGIQLMSDSFRSLSLTIIGSLVLVLVLNNASTSLMTVNSRMLWAFSRQDGLPFSKFLRRLGHQELPHNAVVASVIMAVSIGAIQLGSTIVVNAILGSAIICCNISYAIPIGLLLLTPSRTQIIGRPWFTLGRFGRLVNGVALLWLILASVALSFPVYRPITLSTMNFACISVGVVAALSVVTWFTTSKKHYITPTAVIEPN